VDRDCQCLNRLKVAVEAVMFGSIDTSRGLAALLQGAAFFYGTVVRSRARLYAKGCLAAHRLPCKVVSVGNITLGGTGKTPASLYMARLIHEAGFRVAVISRGYKGRAEQQGGIVSDGRALRMTPADAGDEPYLMARHLLPLGIPVIVGGDRVRSGRLAIERFSTEVLVLDDGFQHMRLRRDLNLVLLDARKPFGNGHLLPRGALREPLAALARADACLLTRCPRAFIARIPGDDKGREKGRFPHDRQHPVFPATHAPFAVEWIADGKPDPLREMGAMDAMSHAPIFAFSGLARNDDFQASLRDMGFDLKGWKAFADHHAYSREELAALETLAARQGAELMVTTEKDRVKIDAAWIRHMPLLVVGVRIDLGAHAADFRRFVIGRLGTATQSGAA
jgi:tetraacyldisaccharide 4'-kinase